MLLGGVKMRERIVKGFKDIASEVGFYRATVDELSARTGISKRTIYRYFRSKEEIIRAVITDIIQILTDKNKQLIHRDNPKHNLIDFIKNVTETAHEINPLMINDLQKYYPSVWRDVEAYRSDNIHRFISSVISGNNQGHFREIVPEIFITALLASIREVVNPSFIIKHGLTIEQTITALFEIFLYGIFDDKKDTTKLK